MLTVALTGGIGSGKTAVCNIFHQAGLEAGLEIIDADVIARNLLAGSLTGSHSQALKKVYNLFGSDVFNSSGQEEGQLDRKKLRTLVFSSKTKKKQLEELLHPLVYEEIFSQIKNFSRKEVFEQQSGRENQPINIVIIAIPLLFETHAENKFDRVLVIDVPVELQIERSMQRDQCSRELIEQIINSQVDRQTRLNHADDVIDNSGTLTELREQVKNLLNFYRSLKK